MPWGIYLNYKNMYITFNYLPLYRKVMGLMAISQFVALFLLNAYWYYLIIIGIGKMLGFIKSK